MDRMSIINTVKSVKNLLTGKSIKPVSSLINIKYPFNSIFMSDNNKSTIHCIMCGFPRSGTHWIRNVIEKSTGIPTYEPYRAVPNENTKNILLIKIHARNKFIARTKVFLALPPHTFNGKYIYTYRDPRDAIISLYEMYIRSKKDEDMSMGEFVKLYDPIRQYSWEVNAWVFPRHNGVMLVKFEDLKKNPSEKFRGIFDYLELKSEVNLETIGQQVSAFGEQKRPRATAYGWKNAPERYQWLISEITRQLHDEIKRLGYDT